MCQVDSLVWRRASHSSIPMKRFAQQTAAVLSSSAASSFSRLDEQRPASAHRGKKRRESSADNDNRLLDEHDEEEEEEEEDLREAEEDSAIVMALCYSQGVLGLACYREEQNCLLAAAYELSAGDAEPILASIKTTLSPTLFLLHPNILASTTLLSLVLTSTEGEQDAYAYKTLKSSSWQESRLVSTVYEHLCIARGRGTRRRGSRGGVPTAHARHRERESRDIEGLDLYNYLCRTIDMEKPQIHQALVALVTHLQSTIFSLDEGKVSVADILPFPDHQYLQMDAASFRALQIFCEEIHPNWIRGKGRSKEGFSLFALFDRTSSVGGRRKLREWMRKPFAERDKILARQQGVEFAVNENNREFVQAIAAQLRHFADVPKLLIRVKKAEAQSQDWLRLHASLVTGAKILQQLLAFAQSHYIDDCSRVFLDAMAAAADPLPIVSLAERLAQVIDFAQSELQRETIVLPGVDAHLDEKRALYEELEEHLVHAAHELLAAVPVLEKVSVEYVPQLGYLAAVNDMYVQVLRSNGYILETPCPTAEGDRNDDNANYNINGDAYSDKRGDNQFSFVFSEQDNFFFKHPIVAELDARLGDLRSDILDRQRLVLLSLEEEVLACELSLVQLSNLLSEVDAFFALGRVALQYKLTKPEIVEHAPLCLAIKNGRHLLQELTVDAFVANDTFLSAQQPIALITGPNGSGKSIYLKQVGLIVFLAHIGSFVPCEQAVIGLTDRLLTRIAAQDSVHVPRSSFTTDLQQVAKMLRFATPRSLCLVDEFGKGTSPLDGVALLAALLQRWTQPAHRCKVLCALHFAEVLQEEVLGRETLQVVNCFCMETLREHVLGEEKENGEKEQGKETVKDDAEEPDSLIPLYKLKHGVERYSEGILCAERMGLRQDVLARARARKRAIVTQQTIEGALTAKDEEELVLLDELLLIIRGAQQWDTKEGEPLQLNRAMEIVQSIHALRNTAGSGASEVII